MKKTMNYLFGASVLALTFVATATTGPVAAQTCVNAPTCAELGYTLTSTTTCAGTPLKCPFDKTKYYCTTAESIMPDYSKRINLSRSTTYTVGSGALSAYNKGWIFFGTWGAGDEVSTVWRINGIDVGQHHGKDGHWNSQNSALFPVSKGDTLYYYTPSTRNVSHNFYFIPTKN